MTLDLIKHTPTDDMAAQIFPHSGNFTLDHISLDFGTLPPLYGTLTTRKNATVSFILKEDRSGALINSYF